MYEIRQKMREQPSRYNPLALLYTAYQFGQLNKEWPTTDGADLTDRSEKALQEFSQQNKPFFLWTHFMDVHAPISPHRAAEANLASIPTFRSLFWDASRAGRFYEPNYDSLYDSSIRYVDNQVAKIVDQLRDLGKLDETVIIVTGDHGEVLFDRQDVYGHPPHYHYDDLLHVPLLVYDSDGPSGRIQSPISSAWIHEVIGEAIDIEMEGFPSQSGSESIRKEGTVNFVVSDTLNESGHTVTVRNSEWKVIVHRNLGGEQIRWEYADKPIGYHYRQDRGERSPTDETPTELLEEARSYLVSKAQLPEITGEFSAATEQRLQDLGYKM